MEDGRMGRCLALIQREAEMEKDFQERTDHAAIVNARAEEEAKLGSEIVKVRDEEVNELMRRHTLRERDPSLRELEKNLQAGYVCRDLKQQILHNEYKRLQDKVEESHANRILQNALYNDNETAHREEQAKIERNAQLSKDLQQQLVNKQRQRQCQYEDTLIEKKMQEGIMRTLADEDQRELQQKRDETEKMRNEMVTFKRAREAWKEKQKQMVVLEEKEIEKQWQAASDRSSAIVAETERKMKLREEQINKMGQKVMADAAEKLQREDIIRTLQEQEYLEKNVQDDLAQRRKNEIFREESKMDRDQHVKAHQLVEQQEHDAEALFRKMTEEQMALYDEKEDEKERIKKQKNRQYSMDLQEQIAGNALRRKADHDLEQRRAQDTWDWDKSWRAEVSEERKKIVEEHVPQLLGYLKSGVVKHDDLPVVRAGANKHPELAELDIESLATCTEPQRFSKCNEQCKTEEQMAWYDENDDEKERIKKQKNRQYSMDLQEQIAGNALRRKADHDLEQRRAQDTWDWDKSWRAELSEERQKIIDLQSGVVKHDDLPVVRAGANKHPELAELDIESLATCTEPQRFSKCNEQCKVLREY
ncbi:meiosis-specific nuclear structural protein 1-like isoform X2 [Epargyreus clarus]